MVIWAEACAGPKKARTISRHARCFTLGIRVSSFSGGKIIPGERCLYENKCGLQFPSSQRRGGCATNKKSREATVAAQTGWSERPERFTELTTPALRATP